MTTGTDVHGEVVDGVARVRLARPERRNALSRSMTAAMRRRLVELASDPEVRALVIAGDERAFCAGVDLGGDDADEGPPLGELLELLLEEVRMFPVPTVAEVRGPCIGVGCALATACDVRLAHPGARFAVPGARLGIRYPSSSLRRLVDLVGPGRASVMLLSGRSVGAAEAAAWGLADVCSDAVEDEVRTFVDAVAEVDPEIVRVTREAIRSRPLHDAVIPVAPVGAGRG